jgi:hypothetical protein
LTSCIGWLLDVSIDNDHAMLWIKTEGQEILKLRDSYHPGFYVLPRNESLFQILCRKEEIAINSEDKHIDLFDSKKVRKLIYVLYSIPQIIMYLTRVRKFYSQYGSYVNNNLVSIVYEVIWIITINNSL